MDTQVQPSFIPKKPLTGPTSRRGGTAMGTFIVLVAMLIFVASLISAGSAFAYENFLKSSITQKADTLKKAEAAFDPATIQDLVRLDSRINNAQALLGKHISSLAVFSFLSQQTLQNVQFTAFTLELQSDGSANMTLSGLADGFSTVALQSDQFGASKVLRDVVFSNIVVNQAGKVGFNVKAAVDPSLVNYAKALSAPAPTIGDAQNQLQAGTTTQAQ
jgi:hypothetical protein